MESAQEEAPPGDQPPELAAVTSGEEVSEREGPPSRRRRRRRRGSGSGAAADAGVETETSAAAAQPEAGGEAAAAAEEDAEAPARLSPSARRRRRRKSRAAALAALAESGEAPEPGSSGEGSPEATGPAEARPPGEEAAAAEPLPGVPSRSSSRRRRRRRVAVVPLAAADAAALGTEPGATDGSEGAVAPLMLVPKVGLAEPAGHKRRRARRPPRERLPVPDAKPKTMLITVGHTRTQIAVLEEGELVEHYIASQEDHSIVGNIYLGRVQNVLPGMEAAFINIGEERNAVLYAGEVTFDEDVEGVRPRIEKVLKSGQPILAQVTK
ncbi:MAG TPA: hypothetical protein VKY26_13260, partial [Actinomycetota bacterium]|nr:hypothetical protein [Actinomycetota bacterium]